MTLIREVEPGMTAVEDITKDGVTLTRWWYFDPNKGENGEWVPDREPPADDA